MSEKLETVAWAATSEENVVEALSFNSSRSRFTTALVFRSQAESLLSERDATIAQQAEEIRVLKEEDTKCHLLKDSTINKQAAEIEQLKNAISLSEDSRLMDEHLKLERDNERQAERLFAKLRSTDGLGGS